jgi:hypothetical protein
MWASPSNIPANTSLTSSGNFIAALSEGDKRIIPLVERPENYLLVSIKKIKGNKSTEGLLSYNISIMVGLSLQFIIINCLVHSL